MLREGWQFSPCCFQHPLYNIYYLLQLYSLNCFKSHSVDVLYKTIGDLFSPDFNQQNASRDTFFSFGLAVICTAARFIATASLNCSCNVKSKEMLWHPSGTLVMRSLKDLFLIPTWINYLLIAFNYLLYPKTLHYDCNTNRINHTKLSMTFLWQYYLYFWFGVSKIFFLKKLIGFFYFLFLFFLQFKATVPSW